ncbi:MAG: hypothetical protein R3C59_07045 [Planctomycetaceae bacterium]
MATDNTASDDCITDPQDQSISFQQVLRDEQEAVRFRRARFIQNAERIDDVAGLAISGGGIRVATFALGAIQAMAAFEVGQPEEMEAVSDGFRTLYTKGGRSDSADEHTGILGAFDYLSTVSGGGFIGGWLTSWIQRQSRAVNQSASSAASGMVAVCRDLRFSVSNDKGQNSVSEAREVSYLRRFSNYLTPQVGLFSADTWTVAAIYLRNFLLNVITLAAVALAVIVAIFLVVRAFGSSFSDSNPPQLVYYSGWIAVMLAFGAWTFSRCLWNVGRAPRLIGRAKGHGAKAADGAEAMWWTVVLFCLTALAAVPALAARGQAPNWLGWMTTSDAATNVAVRLTVLVALLHGLPGIVCLFPTYIERELTSDDSAQPGPPSTKVRTPTVPLRYRIWSSLCAVMVGAVSGAVGGLLLYLILVARNWNPLSQPDLFVVFGPPLILFTVTVGVAVEVGFLSRSSSIHEREWWARLAAWLLICAVAWLSVTAIAVYSGPAFAWMGWRAQLALGSGAIGISALAAKLGSSAETKHTGSGPIAGFIVRIGPALFLLALAIGMSAFVRTLILSPAETNKLTKDSAETETATDSIATSAESRRDAIGEILPWTVKERQTAGPTPATSQMTLTRQFTLYPRIFSDGVNRTRSAVTNTPYRNLWLGLLIPLALAAILSARFDINMNSLNTAWANRIIRCYLGASNQSRAAHPSTGFDETDDLPLIALRNEQHRLQCQEQTGGCCQTLKRMVHGLIFGLPLSKAARADVVRRDYDGPYHLVNGAMNVYGADDLSRQERRAESFVMSPLYCGYSLADARRDEKQNRDAGRFTHTDQYAGQLTLGSAIGISGAAASPNMGYHTMPSLAALMTVFNVRLGWWLPNPAETRPETLRSRGPRLGLRYLASELFSRTTSKTRYVYVTDGGHFENLATYELIRRRTKFILVLDGEADPEYEFHGLGSLVRKCRVDFGVDIQISAHAIEPAGVSKIRHPLPGETATLHDRLAKVNYALGLIHYPGGHGVAASQGLLIYVKSSLVAADALHVADLRQYAETHPSFPHESTADQFFSESQFESYRLLGQLVMSRVLTEILSQPEHTAVAETATAVADSDTPLKELETTVRALSASSLRQTAPSELNDGGTVSTPTSTTDDPQVDIGVTEQQRGLAVLLSDFREHCSRFRKPRPV